MITTLCPSQESLKLWDNALSFIEGGVQTLSKAPSRHVEGVYPYFIDGGKGAYVYDSDGNEFIDYPLGLGTIILGHAEDSWVSAINEQVKKGVLFSLPSTIESKAAELVLKLSPSSDKLRFFKTGSEATSAAVKLARSFTKRDHVLVCGYHGWHDWYTVLTDKDDGIPASYKQFVSRFAYNDINSVRKLFKEHRNQIAAVIMEPCIYDEPKGEFLEKVKQLCYANDSVLIFDEMVTGTRFPGGSAQKFFKIEPDLSCFGKGIANGMPLAALCGSGRIMKKFSEDTFCSTTFGGETASLAACIATLNIMLQDSSVNSIWKSGLFLKRYYNQVAESMDLDTSCIGYPCRTMFLFPTGVHKSLFWQECIRRGVFFGYAQFVSLAHNEDVMIETMKVIKESFMVLKDNWSNPMLELDGPSAKEVFRLVATQRMR